VWIFYTHFVDETINHNAIQNTSMKKKNVYLFVTILTTLVFIGYLSEPGPYMMFGYPVNIWVIRLAWLLIVVSNISNYLKIKEAEKPSN